VNNFALLFDLDQTLVLTSELDIMRQERNWPQVYHSFYKTALPPGTRKFISDVSKLAFPGVVTSSPRNYAERLLAYHKIDIPVIVAYHDVQHIKPNPECIFKAAQKIQIPPKRCVYIGDRWEDILCAENAGTVFIGINWGGLSEIQGFASRAYAVCHNWDDIYMAIIRSISLGASYGL
jgi:HAD superfamily hydrolase (TIGR01549 family)